MNTEQATAKGKTKAKATTGAADKGQGTGKRGGRATGNGSGRKATSMIRLPKRQQGPVPAVQQSM